MDRETDGAVLDRKRDFQDVEDAEFLVGIELVDNSILVEDPRVGNLLQVLGVKHN